MGQQLTLPKCAEWQYMLRGVVAVRPLTGFGVKREHRASAHNKAEPDSRASGPGQAPSAKASPEDRP